MIFFTGQRPRCYFAWNVLLFPKKQWLRYAWLCKGRAVLPLQVRVVTELGPWVGAGLHSPWEFTQILLGKLAVKAVRESGEHWVCHSQNNWRGCWCGSRVSAWKQCAERGWAWAGFRVHWAHSSPSEQLCRVKGSSSVDRGAHWAWGLVGGRGGTPLTCGGYDRSTDESLRQAPLGIVCSGGKEGKVKKGGGRFLWWEPSACLCWVAVLTFGSVPSTSVSRLRS